jgi:hypothetical protein
MGIKSLARLPGLNQAEAPYTKTAAYENGTLASGGTH